MAQHRDHSSAGSPSAAGEDALTLHPHVADHLLFGPWELRRSAIAAALDAAYERGRAAGPVVDEATVERVGRALCVAAGDNPDAIGDGSPDPCPRCGFYPAVLDHAFPRWRTYRIAAKAALAAIPAPPAGEPDRG